jgi:tetratricopeptide (TPR) repeat protein
MEERNAALNHIINRLKEIHTAIKLNQAIKNYSLNGVAENYFRDVFNFIAVHCGEKSFLYGCHFENLNFTDPNAAHIDLVDKNKKFAFQITSTKTAEKIRNTLAAKNKPAYSDFNIKIFYLLGKPEAAEGTLAEGKLNKKNVNKLNDEFSLNVLDCLFDSTDLFREIDNLEGGKLIELKNKYFTKPSESMEKVIANSQKSADWLALCGQRDKLQKRVHQYPSDTEFQQELAEVLQQMEDFKRDVRKLAEEINKLNINTERGRSAKAKFEAGDYQAARQILNTEEMAQEQTSLLERQQQIQTQQTEIAEQLASNATEFVLKAQLTAIDYSLPDRIEQTIALFETALKSARNPDHLLRYANFLQDHSQFAASQPLCLELLAGFREIGDKAGEGATLNNLGAISHVTGDYTTALDYLQQSLAIQLEMGNKVGEGGILNNLSQIYKARGDYATALDYLQQSLVIQREIGNKAGEGATLNNLSQIYDARGDYDTALEYLQQSLTIQREIGNKAGEGATLNNLSQIYDVRGDYDTALDYLQQSLVITRTIGNKSGEGTTLNNLATTVHARGDYATALDYWQQSLAIQREIGDQAGLCTTLFNIGHIHGQNNEPREALQSWVAAYQIAKKIGHAQVLNALEKLAGQIGLPNGLAGWEALAK